MTEKDLLTLLYQGKIGSCQAYNLKNLLRDGYDILPFTTEKINDCLVTNKIEVLIRQDNLDQAIDLYKKTLREEQSERDRIDNLIAEYKKTPNSQR